MFDVISPRLNQSGVQTVQVKSVNRKGVWNILSLSPGRSPSRPSLHCAALGILCVTEVEFSSSNTQVSWLR